MPSQRYTVTDAPKQIATWVPPHVLVINRGAAPVYLGGNEVTASAYAVAVQPKPATLQSSPQDIREVTPGADGLYAVSDGGAVEIEVINYGGGGPIRRDYLRALVSEHTGGTPIALLSGDTLDEIIASANQAASWIRNVISADLALVDAGDTA